MNKFLLIINGPMCAGKSTITKIFLQKENVFRGSSDRIKWLISNYSGDNQKHREIAKKITLSAIESAMDSDLSVVIDGGFGDFKDKYKELASKYKFKYLSVNIEAPLEILEQRFLERVESAKRDDSKTISVTTLEGFHSRYNWYLEKNKDNEAFIFDSNKLAAEDIALNIEELIASQEGSQHF
jgi:predicted kinase